MKTGIAQKQTKRTKDTKQSEMAARFLSLLPLMRWVSERLGMGHYTRVTQAVSRAGRKPSRKLRQLREILLELETAKSKGVK